MTCPDCRDNDPDCIRCDGSGAICDICGEAAEAGASFCSDCQADE